ncbi:hypothetical protein LEP1GSC170_2764 [Leptospira interrogans serovar Bataviae str. HAI135]|nr:hypothetical protein LEP1GSC170_2764 [Leptospira interrogans serovar Bataviae str. HAI135]
MKLNTTLSMNRVVEWELVLQRICRNSHRFILRSKYLWVGYEFLRIALSLYIFLKYSNLLNQTHTIFSYFFMLSSDL